MAAPMLLAAPKLYSSAIAAAPEPKRARNSQGGSRRMFLSISISVGPPPGPAAMAGRSEEHTSELQSLMRNSYAVFCLKKKKKTKQTHNTQKTRTNKNTS